MYEVTESQYFWVVSNGPNMSSNHFQCLPIIGFIKTQRHLFPILELLYEVNGLLELI